LASMGVDMSELLNIAMTGEIPEEVSDSIDWVPILDWMYENSPNEYQDFKEKLIDELGYNPYEHREGARGENV